MHGTARLLGDFGIWFDRPRYLRFYADHFIRVGNRRRLGPGAGGLAVFLMEHESGDRVDPHRHDFFEMVLVLRGEGRHECGGRTTVLRGGDVLWVIHDLEHHYRVGRSGLAVINVCFDPALIGGEVLVGKRAQAFHLLRPFFSGLEREAHFAPGPRGFQRLLGQVLELLLSQGEPSVPDHRQALRYHLLSTLCTARSVCHGPWALAGGDPLAQAWAILKERFADEALSLDSLAKATGVGRFFLSREFTRVHGKTFTALRNTLRLERAKDLVLSSRLSSSEIAQACGFANLSHFHRLFRQAHGGAPLRLRTNPVRKKTQFIAK